MFKSFFVLSLFFFAQTAEPLILSPQAGETLRGQVQIVGKLDIPNFSSAELAFSYASDPNSWFAIQTLSQIPETQNLFIWDTTLVTDGDYILHLRVFLQDGSSQDVVISDLKIRNDIISVTDTPAPAALSTRPATATFVPIADSVTVTPIFPTPTNLPANPASVNTTSIYDFFIRGGLIALVLFIFFALILRLRKN